MPVRKRQIVGMFIVSSIIYVTLTLFFIINGYQLPGVLNLIWVMIGGIGAAWFITAYNNVQHKQ